MISRTCLDLSSLLFFDCMDALHALTQSLRAHGHRWTCHRCQSSSHWVSHGFVYVKQIAGKALAVGKRLLCTDRGRDGCGATLQLRLSSRVPRLHKSADAVDAFLDHLDAGAAVEAAYQQATAANSPRQAWRWMLQCDRHVPHFRAHTSHVRTDIVTARCAHRSHRLRVLLPTFAAFTLAFDAERVRHFQACTQTSFFCMPL
jgi:hypothetical protein